MSKEKVFWLQPLEKLFEKFQSSAEGLRTHSISGRLKKYGLNTIASRQEALLLMQFLGRFKNPLVILLISAAILSAIVGESRSCILIISMVMISVVLDFTQEYRAGKAAEKLRHSIALHVCVLRDGKKQEIPATQIVPGDIVFLEAGDLIPADSRIISAHDLFVNQALLTGETFPVEKYQGDITAPDEDIGNARNAVFMGTSVVSGYGQILICRTGRSTFLGGISDLLQRQAPPTAFTLGIKNFGFFIMRLTILLVFFVLVANLFFHRPWLESVLFALALAVGMTPEFLPMEVSISLARGAMRMAKKKVIVKRLSAIHDLGSMDILCTDKTGTLTQAHIQIERYVDCEGNKNSEILNLAYLNSYFQTGVKNPLDKSILGFRTFDTDYWKKIDEIPFDFESRCVSVLLEKDRERSMIVKGAPENILKLSKTYRDKDQQIQHLDQKTEKKLHLMFKEMSQNGLRVLALAQSHVSSTEIKAAMEEKQGLTFVGFITFYDPPKKSAARALAHLKNKGIHIKIITGDNEDVTQHLCSLLGLEMPGVLTGSQILAMDDQALRVQVEKNHLFCRVTPAQKNRIIGLLKQNGHTVGFMGDGINDAPSLHMADVGISVDTAVDVAREAADFILLEENLEVVHDAVVEGRYTFENIMKYIMMMTSSNLGNMLSMAGATLFLPFIPMMPPQILLNNLLYDFSQIPIPLDNVDIESVKTPRKWDMKFIRNFMIVFGPVSSIFDFLTFYIMLVIYHAPKELFQTGWFIESLATQTLVIFIIRTRLSPFQSKPHPLLTITTLSLVIIGTIIPFTFLGKNFDFTELPLDFLAIIFVIVFCYLLLAEICKRWFYKSSFSLNAVNNRS
ncbi:magnesium-transporting ATPase, P-type 1 [Caedimonas varicaedens]|jgi:Mg2+-importing ATPase|uniref:Magnesium-transporting ATPase, P-type 1 n=1 Tax=Caedimonas varicaedens TaxID=1629334 RepID=A0A0K8MDR9_9PROT|nr:magnesium-transporting ATPase, P-type 1 [Caedimonas varicaedens]